MRCINKSRDREKIRNRIKNKTCKKLLAAFLVTVLVFASGCGVKYDMPYDADVKVSSLSVMVGQSSRTATPFAANLCVVGEDRLIAGVDMEHAEAAVLFDVNRNEVLYSKNAHERLYPASLTKVMTALVALQNASLDQKLTATSAIKINESGAQLSGLKVGDTMTLDQALHIMLVYSANDVANMIAENVGGTVEDFTEMMNAEAKRLGATNTHFDNPNGLTSSTHFTTPYDLYLIFNEAIKYESFNEIIQVTTYQTTYHDANGNEKQVSYSTTNGFLKGSYEVPSNVKVIGGKTGTTAAAGHCLVLLSKDTGGSPYISIILHSDSTDDLYREMAELLEEINK